MKIRFTSFAAALCLAGIAVPALAASTAIATPDNNTRIEAELAKLQTEVRDLRSRLKTSKHLALSSTQTVVPVRHTDTASLAASQTPTMGQAHLNAAAKANANAAPRPRLTRQDFMQMVNDQTEYLPFDLDVPGQAFVSTGPYVGVPIQFAGSNLIINSPSVNTDVQLLNIRKHIIEQLTAMGGEIFKEPYHSHLLLSGLIESQASYVNNSTNRVTRKPNGGSPSTDIDVTNMSIDFTVFGPNEWTLGFVELTYDNSTPAGSVFTSPSQYRVSNSRVLVNKAFVTIGDLVKSPIYGSFGQFYVPFGVYSSALVSAPFTQSLTRTKARAIEIGFQQQRTNSLYGSAFIFRGDTHASSTPKVNNGGLNLGYKLVKGPLNANFGGSVIANIADSAGMQVGNAFNINEQIVHRVPGYNLRGNFAFGDHVDVILEYVGASTRFNPNDMAFNGHGAKPSAIDTEGTLSFTMLDKPTSVAIGYQKSNQALALGLPLTRYSLVFNTSWWRNTLQSIEFRHDREYAASNTAVNAGNVPAIPETGKGDNAITAQFDYYF